MASLVADYGSSSSDDDEKKEEDINEIRVSKEEIQVSKTPSTVSVVASGTKRKKRKDKFSFAILPPDIQAALQRPAELDDNSDDDDVYSILRKKKKSARTTTTAQPPAVAPAPAPHITAPPPVAAQPAEPMATGPYPPPEEASNWHHHDPTGKQNNTAQSRALERALQQGQFDSLPQMTEVSGVAPDSWTPNESDEARQKLEKDLRMSTQYCDGPANGMTGTRLMPSRLQRQRHQLNQLTYDARLQEFELLERKGQGLKSKKETQAKYGW